MNIKGRYRKPIADASTDDARLRIEHERANNALRGEIQAARDYADERISELLDALNEVLGAQGFDTITLPGRK
ncbi:MAG: hypothetical protein C4519_00340 [Desulfobacteraceae bacterium]|nr:MAG: hypothetical protein C4519_00340 [Desulfobacteraceae bacterium]